MKMLIFNQYIPIAGALWFLMALFLTEVIYFFIDYFIVDMFVKSCLVAMLALLGCVAHSWIKQPLPLSLGAALVALGFYHIGYNIGAGRIGQYNIQRIHKYFDLQPCIVIVLSIITVVSIYFNKEVNMRRGIYNSIPLFWINAISAIVLLMNISRCLDVKCENNAIIIVLKYVGRYSMVFLCLNQLVILSWFKLLYRIMPPIPGVINIVVSGMSLITLAVVAYFCEKSKVIARTFGLER